jgi:putative hydrolase of the HAD superfamily
MPIPIRSVIFDFGGVLTLAPGAAHWDELLAAIAGPDGRSTGAGAGRDPAEASNGDGPPASVAPPGGGIGRLPRLEELQARYQEHRGGFDLGELSGVDYWAAVLDGLGRRSDGALLQRLFELDTLAWTRTRPEVLEWAAALRAVGRQTGILSNMPTEVLRMVEEGMPWVAEFHPRIFSCRVRRVKPEPAIYRALLDELPVAPGEVLFLDDREENVAAARQVGFQSERFDTLGQILPLLRQRYGLPGSDVALGSPGPAAAGGPPTTAGAGTPAGGTL